MSSAVLNPTVENGVVVDDTPIPTGVIHGLDVWALPYVPPPTKSYTTADGSSWSGESSVLDMELIEQGVPKGEQNAQLHAYACRLRHFNTPWDKAVELMEEAADRAEGGYGREDNEEGEGWMPLLKRIWRDHEPRPVYLTSPEAMKATAKSVSGWSELVEVESKKQEQPKKYVLRNLADVEPQPMQWIWGKRIAVGKITVIAGDGGAGKGHIEMDIIRHYTKGENWPGGYHGSDPGKVIILSAEDAAEDTLVPRGIAAGVDLSKVDLIQAVKDNENKEHPFSLARDMETLEKVIQDTGARLLIVDPLNSYLGKADGKVIDAWRDAELRQVLTPLSKLAEKYKIAVVIVAHFRKGGGGAAIDKIADSKALTNAARLVLVAGYDPHDQEQDPNLKRRLLLSAKANNNKRAEGIGYRIVDSCYQVPGSDPGDYIGAIQWDDKPVTATCEDMLLPKGSDHDDEDKTLLTLARELINEALSSPPDFEADAGELLAKAKKMGISDATYRRAKKAENIRHKLKYDQDTHKSVGAVLFRIPGFDLDEPAEKPL